MNKKYFLIIVIAAFDIIFIFSGISAVQREESRSEATTATTSLNSAFYRDSTREKFYFQDNKDKRTIEIKIRKDLKADIAEDRRILIKRGNEEYKIEPRFKELIAKYARREETVKEVSVRIDNSRPVFVLEKTREVKIFGLFPVQQKIKDTVDVVNLKLIKSEKPWWSIFVKEKEKSQSDNQLSAYNCGNGICEPGETGMKENKEESIQYCPYDCGYAGDGVCGADEFSLTDNSYVSYSEDCQAACGNKVCEPGESPEICPYECGPTACGNQKCEWSESPTICPEDCATACGNGVCDKGESPSLCAADCGSCGDKVCQGGEFKEGYCPKDCTPVCINGICDTKDSKISCKKDNINCGDGICQTIETAKICPQDCAKADGIKYDSSKYKNNPAVPDCGNNICGPSESVTNCPLDCPPPICGNGICDATENPVKCANDCANVCGDNICNKGETYLTCPCDCSFCGDGVCGANEKKCQLDCVP